MKALNRQWTPPVISAPVRILRASELPVDETRRVTVRLREETFERLKLMGVDQHRSVQSMVEDMIEGGVDGFDEWKAAKASQN